MLTAVFSPSRCASCKLCCNFHPSSAWETPFLEPELLPLLQEVFHVELMQRPDGSFTFKLPFASTHASETANCPMLDTSRGCRLSRENRPFECRIWPLRVMKLPSGGTVLGCYRDCPALDASTAAHLAAYAHSSLRARIITHAKRFPQTIRPYDDHYSILEPLPELDSTSPA